MPITYEYETAPRIIRAKVTGLLTTDDLLNYLKSITEDTAIKTGFIEFIDFEKVSDLVISYVGSTQFPYMWENYMKKGCKAVLVYAPTDLGYGTVRMLRTVIFSYHEEAEDLLTVSRSKKELENKLKEILKANRYNG